MSGILLTAYGQYDSWDTNASQLVLERLKSELPTDLSVATRVYPVAFGSIRDCIAEDLADGYDYAIHMGQAPGYAAVTLEAIGVNVAVTRGQLPEEGVPLVPGGPTALQTQLPVCEWAAGLRSLGIPAVVSYHAGTYLCNAALYLSRYEAEQRGLSTQSAFLHLPLTTEQVAASRSTQPSLPLETTVYAVRWIVQQLIDRQSSVVRSQ